MNPQDFRLLTFFTLLLTALVIETLKPARPWKDPRKKRLAFHFGLSIVNTLLLRVLTYVPLVGLILWTEDKAWGIRYALNLSGVTEIAVTFVVFDAYDYMWHRLNHRLPFLWRFHQVHHMDTHVDLTTSLRFHPGELLLSFMAKSAWIFMWGPSLWAYAICMTGITAYSQFHHSNISLPPKIEQIVRWVHMTPRLHAGHHTRSIRTRDANYSTIFLIWDRLFGTLKEPDDRELQTLGLDRGRSSYLSWAAMLKAPFMRERIP